MNVERYLRLIGGAIVMASLALGFFLSPWWYLLTAFVGLNLFQSGLTNWCPMMTFLRMMVFATTEAVNVRERLVDADRAPSD